MTVSAKTTNSTAMTPRTPTLYQQARQAGMGREAKHATAHLGQAALAVDGGEFLQQRGPSFKRCGVWHVEPVEATGIADTQRRQREQRLGQVEAADLRDLVGAPRFVVVARVQAQGPARRRATRAPCPLDGRGLADLTNGQT